MNVEHHGVTFDLALSVLTMTIKSCSGYILETLSCSTLLFGRYSALRMLVHVPSWCDLGVNFAVEKYFLAAHLKHFSCHKAKCDAVTDCCMCFYL